MSHTINSSIHGSSDKPLFPNSGYCNNLFKNILLRLNDSWVDTIVGSDLEMTKGLMKMKISLRIIEQKVFSSANGNQTEPARLSEEIQR